MLRRALIALALLAAPALAVSAPARLPVVASFSILGDLVQQVGGDKVEVTTLVGPDQDAHVFQPAPRDAQAVTRAKVVFLNGLGFEGWMPRLAMASGFHGLQVQVSAGLQPRRMQEDGRDHLDPHAWQDPVNVQTYVTNIAQALSHVDPANAAYYQQRAAAYRQQLVALEGWVRQQLGTIAPAKRKVITSHDAFGYCAARFGIEFLAPQGMNTDAEASAKDVARLVQQIRRERVKAVFVENITNPRLLDQLAREAQIKVGGELYSDALSKTGGPAGNYLAMYRYNITTLLAGMRQN
ncbi:zinc/manganese transport system substrate-binding protein [Andreprevotia lacus DSM 23236]|jgi:zinc/manganese transport system substrate-binding protein|uniref:Zinc/manganese transport system substrate-binding protein n=1 Tax=Andreprevotia lacus DSM 23236 TaxID=1121001 RepID=A0A1W1Y1E8_9NEIS|nr:metal ABC transporter substrate-binding protein [Andreprevotia lacus]SMC29631.1 zinc/manganese transport system substrate-binding protein [Andreprevotia lacus DSM 23236]